MTDVRRDDSVHWLLDGGATARCDRGRLLRISTIQRGHAASRGRTVAAAEIFIPGRLAGATVRGRNRRGIIAGALRQSRRGESDQRCGDNGGKCKLKAHLKLSPSGMRPIRDGYCLV